MFRVYKMRLLFNLIKLRASDAMVPSVHCLLFCFLLHAHYRPHRWRYKLLFLIETAPQSVSEISGPSRGASGVASNLPGVATAPAGPPLEASLLRRVL